MKKISILSILLLCVVVLSCDDKKKGKVVCYYPQVSHYEVEYYKDSMVITEIGKEGGMSIDKFYIIGMENCIIRKIILCISQQKEILSYVTIAM